MTRGNLMTRLFLGATVALLAASSANAGLLPVSVTITPEAGNFRWTYAIVLPTDMKLQSGNYFTIYDFGGYVAGSASAPAGFTLSVSKTGPTPDRVNPQDDPLIDNLTFKYTGPTIPSGQIGLGNFWGVSTFGAQADSFFTAHTNRSSDGLTDSNITGTIVPTGAVVTPPPGVPEPTTLALAMLGMPVVGLVRMLRRKK